MANDPLHFRRPRLSFEMVAAAGSERAFVRLSANNSMQSLAVCVVAPIAWHVRERIRWLITGTNALLAVDKLKRFINQHWRSKLNTPAQSVVQE